MTVSAKVIADSINPRGVRITTFELNYPRIIHAELLTHRVFSRNSASSRAIPVATVINLVENDPAMPVHWGKNQPGMQAKEELDEVTKAGVQGLWLEASKQAVSIAKVMNDMKAHKQVVNRILEPFQHMKVVLTTTERANWYWLRNHGDADPTIHELASKMKEAEDASIPMPLFYGEWHLPYITTLRSREGDIGYFPKIERWDGFVEGVTLEEAQMISASCCAQVSYRKQDGSLEKAETVFKRLIESEPVHASPIEHQALCFDNTYYWPEGVTHRTRDGTSWSGNLRDWIQWRQLIPGNAKQG